jgi:hypothetical protein
MTFSISEFTSKLGRDGLAKSNVFIVRLTALPNTLSGKMTGNELVFFCKTADIPSMAITTNEHMPQGFGKREQRPTGISLPSISTVFMVDSNHKVLEFFHAWMQTIVNYDTSAGILSEVDGRLPYEIAYKTDYVAQMEVHFFSPNDPNRYYTYQFSNVHPVEVGNLSLSWESNDEIATLPVSFAYDSLTVDGSRSGIVTGGMNRGPGLFEYIASLNSYVQVIKGIRKPQGIQDLVNTYTTVNRIFNNLF